MNDSFLEDLELVPSDSKQVTSYPVDRHVTTRAASSSPMVHLQDSKLEKMMQKKAERTALTMPSQTDPKQSSVKDLHTKDGKKLSEQDIKKQVRLRISERKEKPVETKLKPMENKVRIETKEKESKEDIKTRTSDPKMKIIEAKVAEKIRSRRSGSYKENCRSPEVSSKENRHSDSSKENNSIKKSDSKDKDPVALLNAIKELISIYTKQESTKILRAMQDLHMNSQATLIKSLLFQTDDLIKEMHPSKDSIRMRNLMEQNERLQEEVIILQKQNEELQRKLEDHESLKQENTSLKLKCKELSKQT